MNARCGGIRGSYSGGGGACDHTRAVLEGRIWGFCLRYRYRYRIVSNVSQLKDSKNTSQHLQLGPCIFNWADDDRGIQGSTDTVNCACLNDINDNTNRNPSWFCAFVLFVILGLA